MLLDGIMSDMVLSLQTMDKDVRCAELNQVVDGVMNLSAICAHHVLQFRCLKCALIPRAMSVKLKAKYRRTRKHRTRCWNYSPYREAVQCDNINWKIDSMKRSLTLPLRIGHYPCLHSQGWTFI